MQATAPHVSPFSGSWYPSDPQELRELLKQLFEASAQRTGRYVPSRAAAFVVPHAGLRYSGTVAAAVYRQVQALAPERVILLGFSHHGAAAGAWIPDVDAFETPLGEVAVDRTFAATLLESGAFRASEEQPLCDHSIEIQLPLLQAALPDVRIVPAYVSGLGAESRLQAARALAAAVSPGTVLIASSDFTHYGRNFSYQPFPADDRVADRLHELDESSMDAAGTLDASEFLRVLQATGSTVCGTQPVSLLLETVRLLGECEEIFQETLDYQPSGEITGDFRHSVSYAALGYYPYTAFEIGPEDQQVLLASARSTLAHYVETGRRERIVSEQGSQALDRKAAAFVTLSSGGELRGCIGRREAEEPLRALVPSLALAAALDDPRFDPVRQGERELEVEISVLSPMKRILKLEEFRVNEHGALLEAEDGRGLLLPQVATERGWRATQFLEALARKAGVNRDVYLKRSTRVYVFRAQVLR